jgi:hypothetical protein
MAAEARRELGGVAVLGSGDVGKFLAAGVVALGVSTSVAMGTRRIDDESLRTWASGASVRLASNADAVAASNTVIFCPKVRAGGWFCGAGGEVKRNRGNACRERRGRR